LRVGRKADDLSLQKKKKKKNIVMTSKEAKTGCHVSEDYGSKSAVLPMMMDRSQYL
jgi:hypothetical protein